MIFLKKKNKKNSDPKPAKKKSPWKRNSWLRLNLPDDFSSTIEIPQLQSEKIQTSVFAVNTAEFNKGEDLSPTTSSKSACTQDRPDDDLSCSRNDQLINKQQKSNDNVKDSSQQEESGLATPDIVCDKLNVANVGEDQDCRKVERQSAVCEKELESSPPPSHDNDTESFSSPSSLSLSESVESSLKVEVPLKKEPVSEKEQGEDQLSTKVKPIIVTVSSLKTEPESPEMIKEESPKEESKMMKRKSTQSFIPRSCKQSNGASPEEETSPLRGSSSSHLPILVAKSSIDNCSTHSQEGEKQLSKIPTVGPAKHVKSNSPKTHTSRLPKKRNT